MQEMMFDFDQEYHKIISDGFNFKKATLDVIRRDWNFSHLPETWKLVRKKWYVKVLILDYGNFKTVRYFFKLIQQ